MKTLVLFGIKVFFGLLYFDFLAVHGNTHGKAHASSKYFSCVDCMSKFHTIWYTHVYDNAPAYL